MQRWQLTLLLATAATLGALFAPELAAPLRRSTPTPDPGLLLPEMNLDTLGAALPRVATDGGLALDLALDRSALLRGGNEARALVVTVTAPAEVDAAGAPVDVAMVLDTSGSMGREGKIEAARGAADALVDALRVGDRFSLVGFDDQARVIVAGERFEGDTARLHALVAGLRDDGGTNLWDGVALGEDQLAATAEGPRTLILVSDGEANVGETRAEAFAQLALGYASRGVSVSTIGLGRDFNENLLEGMADAGGGSYRFVGNPEELPTVIAAELERTTRTAARQARVRIHLADGVILHDVYGWETTAHADGVEVNVGDLSAGQSRKIVIAVDIAADALGERPVASAELRWAPVAGGRDGLVEGAITARVTTEATTIRASVDEDATVAAARARAGAYSRASADAWRRGDAPTAQGMLRSASDVITETLAEVDAPALRDDRAALSALETLGYTEGNSYAAKAASEAARELSR